MLEPNNLKKGVIFKYRNSPVQVTEFSHTHKARGSATVTVKIKDLLSGGMQTLTFRASDKLESAELTRNTANFLYQEKNMAYFMDAQTYEQIVLTKDKIKDKLNFLKEGQLVTILEFEAVPIDIELPPKVELKVSETEPGIRGNTADGAGFKPATLESGYQINVPLFIKQDDVVLVNTETGEYVERVSA